MDQNYLVLLADVSPVFVARAETAVTSLGISDGEGVATAVQSRAVVHTSRVLFSRPAKAGDSPQVLAAGQMRHAS